VDVQLTQDVAIAGVSIDGDDVHVGIYGGAENVCATVRFSFPDAADRAVNVARLRSWEHRGTQLSLVVRGGTVRLLSERALFRRALESATAE
jgi:hypothetical protein